MQLEHQFCTTVKGSMPMATYCQTLRNIADWLDDVDAPVSESQLVLQLLRGLPDDLQAQTSWMQVQQPQPNFLQRAEPADRQGRTSSMAEPVAWQNRRLAVATLAEVAVEVVKAVDVEEARTLAGSDTRTATDPGTH
ncbi:hypothetical protein DM860_016727 [Cuscuta australis]|uniref:Uncharacterized protein n=1 Tax=Cuscuta australis TaxID=267555 RepID=A0A328DB77_9ASTE|nr:hypothetical protein DM860_016727 [Cuscuta australis]